jgi:hypothetical protein
MSAMTPEAKAKLSKTIRGLRERLLVDLEDALRGDYNLGIAAAQAKLPDARAKRRERLDAWVDEQVRALPEKERKTAKQQDAAIARFAARWSSRPRIRGSIAWSICACSRA